MHVPLPPLLAGSPTPWGPAQSVEQLAPGIEEVVTAGHGGIRLSPERLAAMPADARTADGWYEEDCEAAWVLHRFADDVGLPDQARSIVARTISRYGTFERVRMARGA